MSLFRVCCCAVRCGAVIVGVRCPLFVVGCCLSPPVSCLYVLLVVDCCLLFVACCSLFVVRCWSLVVNLFNGV